MSKPIPLNAICLGCEACQANRPGGCSDGSGACLCMDTGKDIKEQIVQRKCPRNRFENVELIMIGVKRSAGGVGTELAKMINVLAIELGIKVEGCASCFAHAAEMDAWGPDKCEAELGTIVGWLAVEAERRHLPFDDQAGEALVRMAIDAERGRLAADQTAVNDNSKGV